MIETENTDAVGVFDDLDAAGVLASIKEERDAEYAAVARQLDLAAKWADLHPADSLAHAAAFTAIGLADDEPIAGEGCPLVADYCAAELGTVLGITTIAATRLIGQALELRHRLPRLWALVHAGKVPAWRARAIAETTIHTTPRLSRDAARWVDTQIAAVAGKVGPAQVERLVAEAIKRYELANPDADPDPGETDYRHATLMDDTPTYSGTLRFEATLDVADALDLNRALAHGAATLKALGSQDSLDIRRAAALGELARTQTALDLHTQGTTPAGKTDDGLPVAREVVLHAHLNAHFNATTGSDGTGDGAGVSSGVVFDQTGRLEEGQRLALLDQVRDWCRDTRTRVTIKPVIDLTTEKDFPGYQIPDRIREHVILRDRTCVFPHCNRLARTSDVDHIDPFDHDATRQQRSQPGPTATWNLAALCRRHHRLKTFTAWRYRAIASGTFIWTSPHGYTYRRDHTGTTPLDQSGTTPLHPSNSTNKTDPPDPPSPPPETRRPRR